MGTTTTADPIPPTPVISRLRVALGTFVSVEAEAREWSTAEAAVAAAWSAIGTVDRVMHPHRAGSDLLALGRCPPGKCVRVHRWTWEVLRLSRELHAASQGAFDPCLDDAPGRLADLELLASGEVRPHAPVRVDLGGVAKGFAVDRALEALRSSGCISGLVNAGGDLAAFGARRHLIRCGRPQEGTIFELGDAALATSDADDLQRPAEHRGYYHGTHRSIAASGWATVTAPQAAWADALTKCVLLCEAVHTQALLARFDAQIVRRSAACAHLEC